MQFFKNTKKLKLKKFRKKFWLGTSKYANNAKYLNATNSFSHSAIYKHIVIYKSHLENLLKHYFYKHHYTLSILVIGNSLKTFSMIQLNTKTCFKILAFQRKKCVVVHDFILKIVSNFVCFLLL